MARNTTYRIGIIAASSGILMVLLNGKPVIHIVDNIDMAPLSSEDKDSESRKTREKVGPPKWPFGALHLGNSGESLLSNDANGTRSVNHLCFGALSGIQLLEHPRSEFQALLNLFPAPSTHSITQSTSTDTTGTASDHMASVEKLAALGTMGSLVGEQVGTKFPLPDSFPLPSRISRPLFSVSELDHWERYLSAFSNLNLQSLRPCAVKKRLPRSGPLVLLCHDYRGGYFKDCAWEHSCATFREDLLANSSDLVGESGRSSVTSLSKFVPDVYTFQHWRYIDIFVYFSHERVTIPPAATIQAAHVNGVKVLGTLICEWEAGYLETKRLLQGKPQDKYFYAKQLVEIAVNFRFDGWLLNFEHSTTSDEVPELAQWVREFRRLANEKELAVVWYDSIIESGELKWQSALNESNRLFFDSCDYFFTDYHWKLPHLEKTLELAGMEANTVFVGIDVHGRGTYGGGGWSTTLGLKAIAHAGVTVAAEITSSDSDDPLIVRKKKRSSLRASIPGSGHATSKEYLPKVDTSEEEGEVEQKLSVALFAPGWTLETKADSFDSFERNESRYWEGAEVWNIFSKPFEPALSVYYRQYTEAESKIDIVDFSFEDVLSPFDYSADGVAWAAEKEARALSKDLSKEASGRFPGNTDCLFPPRVGGPFWSWRHIRFNLVDSLIPIEWIDRQPELMLSVWFKGTGPNFGDSFRLRVLLLNAYNECIGEYDSGEVKAEQEWQQMHHVWKDYGPGVRSILWLDGSKDAEHWAGHHGCVIDRPSILVANPHRVDSISSHVAARRLENSLLPFVSSFDVGQGTSLYSHGSPLEFSVPPQQRYSYNLASQSPIPTLTTCFESVMHFSVRNPDAVRSSPRPSGSLGAIATISEASKTGTQHQEKENATLSETSLRPQPSMVRLSVHRNATKLFKILDAKIVDASQVDGGVWHGSSCLKISASFFSASDTSGGVSLASTSNPLLHKQESPRGDEISSSGPSGDAISSPSISASNLRRGRSNRSMNLLDIAKASATTEMATVSLYPLSLCSRSGTVSLTLVFRTIQVNSNAMTLAVVSRRRKETGEALEPYSWDLASFDHRDPSVESSFGWNHFSASWACEDGIVYDGVSIALVAFPPQTSGNTPSSASPRSPRSSPRLVVPTSAPPLSTRFQRANSIAHDSLPSSLTLLIGFLKIEGSGEGTGTESESCSTPLSDSVIVHEEGSEEVDTPLSLDYKLTWSPQSLFASTPIYHVTAHWVAPPVSPSLAHMGPPHFIVTATSVSESGFAKVICQGRTWTPSFEISAVPAEGVLLLTVSTVFPDFSQPPHVLQKIQVSWPQSDA